MLDIDTKYGSFGHFRDIYLFMNEENLKEIEITNIRYCLNPILGKGVYTLDQIKSIIN